MSRSFIASVRSRLSGVDVTSLPVLGFAAYMLYVALSRSTNDLGASMESMGPPEPAPTLADSPIAHDTAQALAQQTADDIRANGSNYDHWLLQSFQQAAGGGLVADGLYGPRTAEVLRSYVADAPAPLPEYTPPGPPNPPSDALLGLAQQVADDVSKNGSAYDHDLIRRFQQAAGDLVQDGIFGPKTEARVSALLGTPVASVPSVTTGAFVYQQNLVHAIHGAETPMKRRKLTAAFQRAERLPVHGQLDWPTLQAMNRYQ